MVEIGIISALVIWSTIVVLRHLFPRNMAHVLTCLSRGASRYGWIRLSAWLLPKHTERCQQCTQGCHSSVSTSASLDQAHKPVKWH